MTFSIIKSDGSVNIIHADDSEKQLYLSINPGSLIIDGQENFPSVNLSLSEAKERATELINNKASDKIIAIYPQWKQANMTARFVQLITLGQTGSAEGLGLQSAWAWIESIRAASNVACSNIQGCADQVAIDAAVELYTVQLSQL